MAQGFVHHDLSRACLAQSSDPIPRVILIGRLALYGPNAARLHEELIPVTARWVDPVIRKGPLSPYGREAETRTLALLETALLHAGAHSIPEAIAAQLRVGAPNDVQELLPHLQARAEDYAATAVEQLEMRALKESATMKDILETQKKHLHETVARYKRPELQLTFQGFNDEEKRQLEANQRYWEKRLAALDIELETEPDRIRNIYEVRARRIEPVGLVYLWPITG